MALHNPNNWHWVNKPVGPWALKWFTSNVSEVKAEQDGINVAMSKVVKMEGDVDVSQRKGKVITIYDVKLTMEFTGTVADETNVNGTMIVPEVAHDTEEDEFVFEIDLANETAETAPAKALVKSALVPQLRKLFVTLPSVLIAEHGKDIQHTATNNPVKSSLPPKVHVASTNSGSSASAASATSQTVVNTTSFTSTEEFRTSADEIYQTFTDPQRLAAFTRTPPAVFEGAKPGGKFALFDGNVSGEYLELEPNTKIVQTWRLKQWPGNHHARLELNFAQNNTDHVTVMTAKWTGVPIGQEEVTQRNWNEYYVGSIKRTFGFGSVL